MKKLPIAPLIIFVILVITFAVTALFFRGEINKDYEEKLETEFSAEAQELVLLSERLFSEYSNRPVHNLQISYAFEFLCVIGYKCYPKTQGVRAD